MWKTCLVLVLTGVMGLQSAAAHAATKQAKASKKQEECKQWQEEVKKLMKEDQSRAVQGAMSGTLAGPLPENWQQLVQEAIKGRLKDPDSAQFKFKEAPVISFDVIPQPTTNAKLFAECAKNNITIPTRYTYVHNWKIEVQVNAKNSFGGYVGFKEYDIRIKDGKVTKVDISIGELIKSVPAYMGGGGK